MTRLALKLPILCVFHVISILSLQSWFLNLLNISLWSVIVWQSKNALLLPPTPPDLQTLRRLCLHVPRKSMKEAEGGWLKYTHINSTRYMDREWAKEQGVHNVSFSKFKIILTLNSQTFFGLKTLMKRLMNIMLPERNYFSTKTFSSRIKQVINP